MRVLIELPSWLGDTVMATPAIENLVHHFNDIEITLIGSYVSIEALKNHPKVIKCIVTEKKYFSLYKFSKNLGSFDKFFCFRGSIRSSILKIFISSRDKFQFNKIKYQNFHQVEKYCHFINDSLSVDLPFGQLTIKLPKDQKKEKNLKPLIGLNPGASYGNSKRWLPKEYAKVAIEFANQYDIVIFGNSHETDIAGEIEKILLENNISNYQNLAGKTSLIELMILIKSLDIFITGDSGPMHLAAAFQIPTVSIFGPTKSDETGQWMNDQSIIVKKNLDCQPCMKRNCPLKHNNCMKLINVKEVLGAVKALN